MTSKLVLPLMAADSVAPVMTQVSMMLTILGPSTPTGPSISATESNTSDKFPAPNFTVIIVGTIAGTLVFIAIVLLAFWYGRKQGRANNGAGSKGHQEWTSSSEALISQHRSYGASTAGMKLVSSSPYESRVASRPPSPREPLHTLPIARSRFEDSAEWKSPSSSRLPNSSDRSRLNRRGLIIS